MKKNLSLMYVCIIHPIVWLILAIVNIALALLSPLLAIWVMVYALVKGNKSNFTKRL